MFELLIPVLGKVLDKILPDTEAANAAKAELMKMQMSGELAAVAGQLEVNKAEAASTSIFIAGWRPFVGWICGAGLGYVALVEPLCRFVAQVVYHYTGPFPVIDTTITLQVLLGMLGLGTLRSVEKVKNVEGSR